MISVAGGAVLDPDNRVRIAKSGLVVWLRARPETLGARVGDGAGRPLLGNDPTAAMRRLLQDRAPLYTELADLKEIGARLFISERTVESHIRNIMNKLGFNSRAQIAGWIAAPDR